MFLLLLELSLYRDLFEMLSEVFANSHASRAGINTGY